MLIQGNYETREVFIDGYRLDPTESQKVYNHSPDGFAWGYAGSGPAQLALAILLNETDEKTAIRFYQKFKSQVIAKLPQKDFECEFDLETWLTLANPKGEE